MNRPPASLRAYLGLSILATTGACSAPTEDQAPPDSNIDPLADFTDERCSEIFHQNQLPEYRLTIASDEWAAMEDEFYNRPEREAQGLDPNPYHPAAFEYRGQLIPNTMIRLKGQSSWLQAIALDESPKMQFVISFNEVDRDARFSGVRAIELDMPRTDATFLRQRLALYYLRRAGIPAQCANNARLVINGDYYGLYTNLERLDKEFLQSTFEGFDDGDLWKGGRYIETNKDSFDQSRLDAIWEAENVAELQELVDLDASVRVWAAEAMVSQADGYYNGRANFFLYDHPTRGFLWLPHDLDSAFDFLPADTSPLYPECEGRHHSDRQHWSIVMSDNDWQQAYVDHLADLRGTYDTRVLEDAVALWSAQIADSVQSDSMKPFSNFDHDIAVDSLAQYPNARAQVVDDWLVCRSDGTGEDYDGDGFSSCFECDDQDATVHPGATEICNGLDDDCDGQIDELPGAMQC